jgi:predicted DNA-binding transcriptional regulator AlpA
MQQLLTAKSLADYLGLAEQTIYNRHSSGGDLPKPIKLGQLLRFHPSDVDVWLESKRHAVISMKRSTTWPNTEDS